MAKQRFNPETAINELRTNQKALRRLNRELIFAGAYEPRSELAASFLQVDYALDLICFWLVKNLGDELPLFDDKGDPSKTDGSPRGGTS